MSLSKQEKNMLEEAGILDILGELSPVSGAVENKFTSKTGWLIDIYEVGYEDEECEYAYSKILAEHPSEEEIFFHNTFCWTKIPDEDSYEFTGFL